MTVQEILDQASNHGFTKIADTLKIRFLNDVYSDITSRELWPFMLTWADVPTVAGQEALNVPANVHSVLAIVDTFRGNALQWERFDRLVERFAVDNLQTRGDPIYFYFPDGANVALYPVPPDIRTMKVRFHQTPNVLAVSDPESAIKLPPRHHRILVIGLLDRLYKMDAKFNEAQQFENEYEKRLASMRSDLFTKQTQGNDYVEVVDPEDYANTYPGSTVLG